MTVYSWGWFEINAFRNTEPQYCVKFINFAKEGRNIVASVLDFCGVLDEAYRVCPDVISISADLHIIYFDFLSLYITS